jgi:hypothetical protein
LQRRRRRRSYRTSAGTTSGILAASILIAEGAPASYVAAVLGHASPAITLSIYSHLFAKSEHAHRTRERMEAAFGGLLAGDAR